jgi:hypothetical protein
MFRPSQARHHEEIHQYIHMIYSQVGVDENVEGSMYDIDLIGHPHPIPMPIEKLSGLMSRRMRLRESMYLRSSAPYLSFSIYSWYQNLVTI